jgi:hypothetical protein
MPFFSAGLGCHTNDPSNWSVCNTPCGTKHACYHANNLFLPYPSFHTDHNHYDTNCLSEQELQTFRNFADYIGVPEARFMVHEQFDAYQPDMFASQGVEYTHVFDRHTNSYQHTDSSNEWTQEH